MRLQLRVSAAALFVLAAVTSCSQSTEGTVAMTTEAGPPLTTRTPSSKPTMPSLPRLPGLPGLPGTKSPSPSGPPVPAPANATTMLCTEYADLDDRTQTAVVQAILDQQDNPLGPEGADVGKTLADVMCQFLPSSTVNQVLLGGGPP